MTPEATPSTDDVRSALCAAMRTLADRGLNRGTSGNASVRAPEDGKRGFWITPSGTPPQALESGDIVWVSETGSRDAGTKPSSEWRLHAEILARRPDLNAVVHTHSPYATVLACARQSIRPVHYLIALAGTTEVPVAPYALFGSDELAHAAAGAFGERGRACLLAHHGLVVGAATLEEAIALAEVMEEQAFYDWHTRTMGSDCVMDSDELSDSVELLRQYTRNSRPSS